MNECEEAIGSFMDDPNLHQYISKQLRELSLQQKVEIKKISISSELEQAIDEAVCETALVLIICCVHLNLFFEKNLQILKVYQK